MGNVKEGNMKYATLEFISKLLDREKLDALQALNHAQKNFNSDDGESVNELRRCTKKFDEVCAVRSDFRAQDFR
jgi:hypothetical protein